MCFACCCSTCGSLTFTVQDDVRADVGMHEQDFMTSHLVCGPDETCVM